jgi:pimeloyl-ACP methyl ester carboxylesterase
VAELWWKVPLDYSQPNGPSIKLFARAVTGRESPAVPDGTNDPLQKDFSTLFNKPWLVFLQGGPGAGNPEPQEFPLTKAALAKDYQVLFLDYRGTGLSTPIASIDLQRLDSEKDRVQYLSLFRADNIVRDCEAVRTALANFSPPERHKWSLFGQSFGGFVSLTYLSFFPNGLRESFITGGLAPVLEHAEAVYWRTFEKVQERNEAYFNKFPEDRDTLAQIARYFQCLKDERISIPGGGFLTFPRLMISFVTQVIIRLYGY